MTSLFGYTPKVDLVDDVLAIIVNTLQDNDDKMGIAALLAEFANTETLSGAKTLVDEDVAIHYLDCNGANRDVNLPVVDSANHQFCIYNSTATTYALAVKNSGGTIIAGLPPLTGAFFISDGTTWTTTTNANNTPADTPYKISVTVSASDLILSLLHMDGTTPSPGRPLWFRIGNTWQSVTAALSVTAVDNTNWAGLGGTAFGTLEQDLFVYLIWNTGPATDIVDIAWSRIPYGAVYSDFSATNTNEKYLKYGNGTAPNSTDDCIVIGRFAATLSLSGTGHVWTVPTFNSANLIQRPIYQTNWRSWNPNFTGFSGGDPVGVHIYYANYKDIGLLIRENSGGVSNTTGFTLSLPFAAATLTNALWGGTAAVVDNNTLQTTPGALRVLTAATVMDVFKDYANAVWTAANSKRIQQMASPLVYPMSF